MEDFARGKLGGVKMIDEKNFMSFIDALENAGAEHISFDDLRKFIDEQTKTDRWIPCSERLPTMKECQENDCRFILDDGNRRYQEYFDYIEKKFVYFNLDGMQIDKCAIAWQSLPEGYKEDTN